MREGVHAGYALTVGITWLVLFLTFRSIPSRVDADGVHFWLRRTYRLSELDTVGDVAIHLERRVGG